VRFREPTAWQRYRLQIIAGATFASLQALLMVALVVTLVKRRRAERSLRMNERVRQPSSAATNAAELERARMALSRLSSGLIQAHEKERAQIAKELHDDLCQRMMALTVRLHSYSKAPRVELEEMRAGIDEICGQFTDLGGEILAISDNLYSRLELIGLASSARSLCREFSADRDMTVDFQHDGVPDHVPNDIALTLCRVLQEALSNAAKHSTVRHVAVSLHGSSDALLLEVADHGAGFHPEAATHTLGLGLIGMRERLSLVGGECTIESRPGAGTRIRARVPLNRPGRTDGPHTAADAENT
jgi:signal transduction histidine kinase